MLLPRAISRIVDKVARQSVGKDWGLYATMLDRWTEIVGTEYAAVTTPVKIAFPHQPLEARRRDGVLTIRLPKGLVMEFTFKVETIRQRINGYFGYDVIAKIAFDPAYGVPAKMADVAPPVDEGTLASIRAGADTVENDDLRSALQSFGEAVAASKAPQG